MGSSDLGSPLAHTPGHSCPRRPESLRPKLTLRPASILSPHFRDRLRYGFLDLLRRLVTKRSAKALRNLKATLPPRIQLSHATYPVRTAATIALTVPTTSSTATSKIPTIQVLRFAKSALVA